MTRTVLSTDVAKNILLNEREYLKEEYSLEGNFSRSITYTHAHNTYTHQSSSRRTRNQTKQQQRMHGNVVMVVLRDRPSGPTTMHRWSRLTSDLSRPTRAAFTFARSAGAHGDQKCDGHIHTYIQMRADNAAELDASC